MTTWCDKETFERATRHIHYESPKTLVEGILRARAIGGDPKRAVHFFGMLECVSTMLSDDWFASDASDVWDTCARHLTALSNQTFDEFILVCK